MNKEDVITLENNKEYVILDIAEFNNEKYLYVVGLTPEEETNTDYKYLKATEENNEYYIEEVTNPKVLDFIVTLFTVNYLNESTNAEQAA